MHYYVEKQVFRWRAKISYIWCFNTWKSRFSHDTTEKVYIRFIITFRIRFSNDVPKIVIFNALLRGKTGAKKVQICCIVTWKSRSSHDATENKVFIWCIITFRCRLSNDAPKTLNLRHYYVDKQVFSWRAKKVQICCIITWKAGFLMTRQNSYIWCINTWKSRFSHEATKNKVYVWCITTFRSRFLSQRTKTYLMHYYMEKQVFSRRAKKVLICRGEAVFLMARRMTIIFGTF